MRLNLEIIRSYGFKERTFKPDWDDVAIEFETPNGLSLTTLTVCSNRACKSDCLEGLDGYVYIETKEELDELLGLTYEEVLNKIKSENVDFNINEYI